MYEMFTFYLILSRSTTGTEPSRVWKGYASPKKKLVIVTEPTIHGFQRYPCTHAGPKEATPPKIKQNIFPCKCPRGYSLTPALTAHTIPETSSYLPRCSSSSSRRRQRQQHLYAEAGLIRDALRLGCNFCVRLMSGTIVCFLYLCARANGWSGKVFFGKNFCLQGCCMHR